MGKTGGMEGGREGKKEEKQTFMCWASVRVGKGLKKHQNKKLTSHRGGFE